MSGQGPSGLGRARSADALPADLLDDESLIDLRRRARATDPAAVLAEERGRRSSASMSSDTQPQPDPSLSGATASAASPDGLCALCTTRPARGTCAMCGRAACAADLWIMLRLCRSCANEGAVERGQRPAKPEAANWLAGGTGSVAGGQRSGVRASEDGT